MLKDIRTALAVPRWALGFFGRHVVMVVGLGAIPAIERFTGQLGARDPLLGTTLEVTTLAVRIVFVALVVRLAVTREPAISALGAAEVGRRLRAFAAHHPRSLVLQVGLIAVLFALADLVPEQLVPALTPVGPLYWAVLLAVKNVTVIPFTMIWLVGAVRQALLAAESPART
ncbi:hypothetical protein [Pseudonocardia xinjiangensis]|uniref:Uncharacterized protein n=1 Tax=Pseudonocardia xinjiangensis TaxID=75289 RepID=A0ABX1RKC7_9PSEU|nr:hypothetical protein [Pseudonocardia xinjiangensis]NMH80803.1 hypothetical protein [Pseudonocardia xinjiangensis]